MLPQHYIVTILGHVTSLVNDHVTKICSGSLPRYYTSSVFCKHIPVVNALNTYFWKFGGTLGVIAIYWQRTPSSCWGASCEILTATIGPWASTLHCLNYPIENALRVVKTGENWGIIGLLPVTNSHLIFPAPNDRAKFQIRFKIATAGAMTHTDRHQQSYLSHICYSTAIGQIKTLKLYWIYFQTFIYSAYPVTVIPAINRSNFHSVLTGSYNN